MENCGATSQRRISFSVTSASSMISFEMAYLAQMAQVTQMAPMLQTVQMAQVSAWSDTPSARTAISYVSKSFTMFFICDCLRIWLPTFFFWTPETNLGRELFQQNRPQNGFNAGWRCWRIPIKCSMKTTKTTHPKTNQRCVTVLHRNLLKCWVASLGWPEKEVGWVQCPTDKLQLIWALKVCDPPNTCSCLNVLIRNA